MKRHRVPKPAMWSRTRLSQSNQVSATDRAASTGPTRGDFERSRLRLQQDAADPDGPGNSKNRPEQAQGLNEESQDSGYTEEQPKIAERSGMLPRPQGG